MDPQRRTVQSLLPVEFASFVQRRQVPLAVIGSIGVGERSTLNFVLEVLPGEWLEEPLGEAMAEIEPKDSPGYYLQFNDQQVRKVHEFSVSRTETK